MSNISAFSNPSPNITFVPICNLFPGLTIVSQISPSILFNNKNYSLGIQKQYQQQTKIQKELIKEEKIYI